MLGSVGQSLTSGCVLVPWTCVTRSQAFQTGPGTNGAQGSWGSTLHVSTGASVGEHSTQTASEVAETG